MTRNYLLILNYLQRTHPHDEVSKTQISQDTGVPMSAITRAVYDWARKGIISEREETYIETLQSGEERTRTRRLVRLTPLGLSWNGDDKGSI